MKRILLDQGMPVPAAAILRERGWDAVHARELGMQQSSNEQILLRASSESQTVITLDRHFPQILAFTAASRPSVVLVRQQRLRGPVADLLEVIWRQHENAIDQGCVLKVGARGVRTRPLPMT